MSKGLMWQPDDKFIDAIQEAAQRFEEKYGRRANVCRMYGDSAQKDIQYLSACGIQVVRDDTITRGHFLLCYEEVKNG